MSIEDQTVEAFERLSRAGFERREGQIRLARMAARSVDVGGWAMAEAPTGSGKGLAYLVPGILAALEARRRGEGSPLGPPQLVVSTANIALQSQLARKDVPAIADALGLDVTVSVLKGRRNYVCRKRLEEQELVAGDAREQVERIARWVRDGGSGDREDLPFQSSRRAWSLVSTDSRGCLGQGCPVSGPESCWADAARAGADQALVVVTNHHYLAVRGKPFNAVLLAVDEAHELEGSVRSVSARAVRPNTGGWHASRAAGVLGEGRARAMVAAPTEKLMREVAAHHAGASRTGRDQAVLEPGWTRIGPAEFRSIDRAAERLDEAQRELGTPPPKTPRREEKERLVKVRDGLRELAARCRTAAGGRPVEAFEVEAPGPWAVWAEPRGGDVIARMAPADVSGQVEVLRSKYPDAVLTSATLAPAGRFTPTRRSLGLESDGGVREELVLPSPFPLERQGVLVVPRGPTPKQPGWHDWARDRVVEAVEAADGRALVLCTSLRRMRNYASDLSRRTSHPVRSQDDAGRRDLIAWFREEVHGVLVASRSFFQGIDVQGEALSLVVIERAPFGVPGDPLEDAVCRLMVERAGGGSAFTIRALPQACETIKQAAGRLIRSRDDRGALVVLDNRILGGRRMGKDLMASLPPFPLSKDLEDVRRVLSGDPLRARQAKPGTRQLDLSRWGIG